MSFDLLDQVQSGLSIRKIGIEEFAESDEFCGKPLFPAQKVFLKLIFLEEMTGDEEDHLSYWINGGGGNGSEITISPQVRERRDWLRAHGYEHFSEISLVGGRRGSKGHVTGMAGAYKMWNTLNLQDPHKHYGIDRDKTILFSCVAGSESQAKDFQYADFSGTVLSCNTFIPYQKKTLETEFFIATPNDLREDQVRKAKGIKTDKVIARLKGNALAANAGTLRGSASIFIVMDEMAHMVSGESKASANKVYDAAKPSLDQFGAGKMMFLNSSPASKVGKFFERHQEALLPYDHKYAPAEATGVESYNGSPNNLTFQFPSWAMFENYKKYRSKWKPQHKFREVITASPNWDPDRLDENGKPYFSEGDKTKIQEARQDEASNPEVYKVERRGQFAEVVDSYLQASAVDMMFEGVPSGYDDAGRPFYAPYRSNSGTGARNHFRYHFHLDPSSTTAGFGFAIGHVEQFASVDGTPENHVVFDLIKRWDPKTFKGNTIDWTKVIDEVIVYADIFRPKTISLDQFQSAQPIQTLRSTLAAKGIGGVAIELATATNEGNWYAAETFKTALNHGFVHAPIDCKSGPAEPGKPYGVDQELKFLQQKNTGGAHPRVERQFFGPVTTKDMADCYDDQTEVLTEHGWKLFRNVQDGERVATRSGKGVLEYQIPTDRIERIANEILLYEENRLNFAVTPKHRMLVETTTRPRGGKGKVVQAYINAEDLKAKKRYKVPKSAQSNRQMKPPSFGHETPEDLARFVGFWLGDGRKVKDYDGHNGVRISQTKPDCVAWIDQLIDRLGWKHARFPSGKETVWHITDSRLRAYLCDLQEGQELRLPHEAKYWPQSSREALLEGLLISDGSWSKAYGRHICFWNTSELLVDDVQILLAHMGRSGRKSLDRPKGAVLNVIKGKQVISTKDLWKLHIDVNNDGVLHPERIRRLPYSGYVYCLTVPNGNLFVRRSGIAMWCGNCVLFVTQNLIGNSINEDLRARLSGGGVYGGQGGYQIGGSDSLSPQASNPLMKQFYADTHGRNGEQRMPRAARPPRSNSPSRGMYRRGGRGRY